ncbi:MAG TPA: CHRD domain-containing protein [Candidatus Acidoferrales bacterium]|nr:CHRD domain-containing protein [Candidatus Acidoferrales bacterium]
MRRWLGAQRSRTDPNPPNGQGFTGGDLSDVIRYILAGDGYANVHTTKYPGGEIRGQIRVHGGND